MLNLIPKPASILFSQGEFVPASGMTVQAATASDELRALVEYLSREWQAATGVSLVVPSGGSSSGTMTLELDDSPTLGEEGYELTINEEGIHLCADQAAGLFYAIQTLLQMIPPGQPTDLRLPAVFIRDTPRFPWRGAMLDVARHFFSVEDVKRYIDWIARYKMNRLHLHLTDDQGWRIEIKSWPRLTGVGGRTQVGGNAGGFYTQEQFKEITDYAASRYVTIIPEIETPGHTNAALASYAELNKSEEAPDLYQGTQVGFSTLNIQSELTYRFLDDVIRELAAMTPGPYIHIGGDEAHSTPKDEYKFFIKRIQEIVLSHRKQPIGWNEIGEAELLPGTIAQHWVNTSYQEAKNQGAKIILSPATKTYLDMKYDASTPLGLDWAALISVKDSYDWEPGSYMPQLEESDILGLEAPLWSETLKSMKDLEYLAFPRILSIAELAWSPEGRGWDDFRRRLAAHGPRLEALGVNFYRAPEIDWD